MRQVALYITTRFEVFLTCDLFSKLNSRSLIGLTYFSSLSFMNKDGVLIKMEFLLSFGAILKSIYSVLSLLIDILLALNYAKPSLVQS